MGHAQPMLIAGVIAWVLLGSSGGLAVEEDRKLSCEPETWIENDAARVWFQGLKGHIKVFDEDRTDPNAGLYTYKTVALVEVRGEEVVASLDLSQAMPYQSLCRVWETDDGTELVYFVTDDVEKTSGGTAGPTGVTFHYKLSDDAQGAKFDLFVNQWPWTANDTELAFDFEVHSPFGFEVAENGIGFRGRDGEKTGYLDWAPNARVIYEDEREDEAVVEAVLKETSNNVSVRLLYTEVEAGYEDLDYDPWVGTGGYEIRDGRIYGDDWLDRQVPPHLRPVYHTVSGLLP